MTLLPDDHINISKINNPLFPFPVTTRRPKIVMTPRSKTKQMTTETAATVTKLHSWNRPTLAS